MSETQIELIQELQGVTVPVGMWREVDDLVQQHPIVERPNPWEGGWALQSYDGSYQTIGPFTLPVPREDRYTDACSWSFVELLIGLKRQGLRPERARVAPIPAGHVVTFGASSGYCVRVILSLLHRHVHLRLTPPDRAEEMSLVPSESVFIYAASYPHQLVNSGDMSDFIFVADVKDWRGITQGMRYEFPYPPCR